MDRNRALRLLSLLLCVLFEHGSGRMLQSGENANSQCKKWAKSENTRRLFTNLTRSTACPCIEKLMQYDIYFKRNGHCYEEFFFQDGLKMVCCYSETGSLITSSKGAGYILVEKYQDSIQQLHESCCHDDRGCTMFHETFPFEDCETYRSPSVASSWGDAHIQPILGSTYDFNGRGEYLFLDVDNGSFIIQCRLDYLSESNTDATIFTAFVLKLNGSESMEITLDRQSRNITSTLGSSSAFQVIPRKSGVMVAVMTPRAMIQFQFTGGDNLGIKFDPKPFKSHALKGLAGDTRNGFISRNGMVYGNDSNQDIYQFGQSWKLSNASESFFNYMTERSFTYYNTIKTPPRFLDKYLNNIMELFTVFGNHSEGQIQEYQNLCNVTDVEVHNMCLLSIARTNSTNDAIKFVSDYKERLFQQRLVADQAPQFTAELPSVFEVILHLNKTFLLNVSDFVTDNDTDEIFTYEVSTKGSIDIKIDNATGLLTLIVNEKLRNYNGSIIIRVKDIIGKGDDKQIHFMFCGCEHPNQCNPFESGIKDVSGSVQQASCSCGKYFGGLFCETRNDVCNVTTCFTGVKCNDTADVSGPDANPCGPCPVGYEGNGIQCEDVNECAIKTSKCNQTCNNTVGNYTCSCRSGYTLHTDGFSCEDKNECEKENVCNDTRAVCTNKPGSFRCDCMDGYFLDTNGLCSMDAGKYVYVGQLNLTLTTCSSNANIDETSIKQQLQRMKPNYTDYTYVEFISRAQTHETGDDKEIVIFGLHSHSRFNATDVQDTLAENLPPKWNLTDTDGSPCNAVGVVELFPDEDGMLCQMGGNKQCDLSSTFCVQENGDTHCVCKSGFEKRTGNPDNLCYNINECTTYNKTYFEEHCVHGKCVDLEGEWNCSCPDGTLRKEFDGGIFMCQGNYSYFGKIELIYPTTAALLSKDGINNVTLQLVTRRLLTSEKIFSTWNGTRKTHLYQLYVTTNIYENTNITYTAGSQMGYIYTIKFVVRLGEPISDIQELTSILNNNLTGGNQVAKLSTFQVEISNDTENAICKAPFGNKCSLESTYCQSSLGEYKCLCKDGYKPSHIDDHVCNDVRECSTDGFTCTNGGMCVDLIGNWTCLCPKGFTTKYWNYQNITCEDIDECQNASEFQCLNGTCNNTNGGWECTCQSGYNLLYISEKNKSCEDINECKTEVSDTCKKPKGDCENLQGSWKCDCETGYKADIGNDNKSCEDINECEEIERNSCNATGGSCKNEVGNWTCTCGEGYVSVYHSHQNITCEDIDECKGDFEASCNGTCVNIPGSWNCQCPSGYEKIHDKNKTLCIDIDECDVKECKNGNCSNTDGGWYCRCPSGFELQGLNECIDINECDNTNYTCLHGIDCLNLQGSWACICPGDKTLNVIDERTKKCEGVYSYVFHPMISIYTDNVNSPKLLDEISTLLQIKIRGLLHYAFPDESFTVNVLNVTRMSPESSLFAVAFLFQMKHNETRLSVLQKWNSSITQGCKDVCLETANEHQFTITFKSADTEPSVTSKMEGNTNGLCEIPQLNTCDKATTICVEENGEVLCNCRAGFERRKDSLKSSCEDIDECKLNHECVNGNCTNTVGNFSCQCPKSLENPVKNATGTTICSGSNQYRSEIQMNVSKELNETERGQIESQLATQIQHMYELKFSEASVTVIVFLIKVSPNRRKREADDETHPIRYKAQVNTFINTPVNQTKLMDVLKNNTDDFAKTITKVTNVEVTVQSDDITAEIVTTTTTVTVSSTTPRVCNVDCKHGGTCVITTGTDRCTCPDGYTGALCGVKIEKQTAESSTDLKTILISTTGALGGFILILVVVIIVVCRRRAHRREKTTDHVSLDTFNNSFRRANSNVYIPQDYRSIDVDKMSRTSLAENRYGLPRVEPYTLHEPLPDYNAPVTLPKPNSHGIYLPRPDYQTDSGNAAYDDRRLPRASLSSNDSGMEVSRGSLNFERHRREPAANNQMQTGDKRRRVQSLNIHSNHM